MAVNASPTGMVLVDSAGTIQLVNDKTEKIFGYTSSELLGEKIELLIPKHSRAHHSNLSKNYFKKPSTREMGDKSADLLGLKKDGTEFPTEIALNPVQAEDGKHVLASIIDLSESKHREKQIEEYSKLEHAMVEDAPIGIALTDSSGNWLRVNSALCDMLGYTTDELFKVDFYQITHPDDISKDKETIEKLSRREIDVTNYNKRYQHKDGHYFWINIHCSAVYNDQGQADYYIGQILNIEKQVSAERTLKTLESQFKAYLDNSPGFISLKDTEHRYILANDTLADRFGVSREELIGKKIRDFIDDMAASEIEELEKAVIATGKVITREGVQKQSNRTALSTIFPVRDEDNTVISIGTISIDITQIKEHEEQQKIHARQLAESEERFHYAVTASNAGIFDWDIPARQLWVSDRLVEMLGLPETENNRYADTYLTQVFHPRDEEIADRAKSELLNSACEINTEYRMKHQSGDYFWVEESSLSVADNNGEVTRIVGTLTDISDRKDAEQALKKYTKDLQRSNSELEQFAYVASHDLQEPLRMVASFTDLLAKRYADKLDEKGLEYIAYSVDGAKRMQKLINDLLSYSRVGREQKPFEEVDLNQVLQDARDNLLVLINDKSADISSPVLPTVFGDYQELLQLIQNLLSNALKYARTDTPPVISIEYKQQPDRTMVFSIADNGIGIEPEFSERIFVIFKRLHGKNEYDGTGIGLAICKKIVERHGGKIWVEQNQPEGSVFKFTLAASE